MATSVAAYSFAKGFREPCSGTPWIVKPKLEEGEADEGQYVTPPSTENLTSIVHNKLGINTLRTWPTIYDGTLSPHSLPAWWKPKEEVDVLICGAGPAGLQVALSLARQGVSFRIIDKAQTPLIAGRADGVQPRFLETLHSWGLAHEVHEEGPLIERTAIYKDGKKLFFSTSHQSDSRYRGLHIITQGQLERIYIRDLSRHKVLVERGMQIADFDVSSDPLVTHPVSIKLASDVTGAEETVRAKFLVGSDGASSKIRKKLNIPFDGVSTDIFWGILDCKFKSDYPHAWVFGSVISSKHGGCVIIPREDGYIRLYTQLDVTSTGPIAASRQGQTQDFQTEGGRVDATSVTAEEVLAQANLIFAPYKLEFAAPLSWFAVWKISERVARSFVSPDNRVFLGGDAAHIHSVMGAFGLNASIMDSCNLAWKIGLCARGLGKLSVLGPSYDSERRYHANRIIKVSGSYLRFICNSTLPLADFNHLRPEWPPMPEDIMYKQGEDAEFLGKFFGVNGNFLLGIDADYAPSAISPSNTDKATAVGNGVRAPNPRLCFSTGATGYLYDILTGASVIHIVVFASNLAGPVRNALVAFSHLLQDPTQFFARFGGKQRFNLVVVAKCLPFESEELLKGQDLASVRTHATMLYDDRAPDEDAHTCYGVDHRQGSVVVVRPDLWVGQSLPLSRAKELGDYFDQWLIPVGGQ